MRSAPDRDHTPGGRRERESQLSAQSWLLSESTVPGLAVSTPRCGALVLPEASQLCAGDCWSAGGWASAAGRRCLGRAGQQVCPVICCDGVGRRQVGRGQQGSWETSLWPLSLTVSGSKADPTSWPLGPEKAAARQSLLLVRVWSLLGSGQPRPLCFSGHSCVPRAETRACCPCTLGQERGLHTALRALPGLICAGKRWDQALRS